jgi:hypothetical protein
MKYASIFALTLLAAVPALAQTSMSWVSHSGLDTNPCSTTQPCRTFQFAHDQLNPNGTVKAMDAGDFGSVTVTKSITIDGNGIGASISQTGGVAVLINTAGPVAIRNLAINYNGACFGSTCGGIDIINNSNASIENVSVTGAPNFGVSVHGGTATIHGLTVTGALFAGILVDSANVIISDSVVRYSANGVQQNGSTAATQIAIERSQLISNTTGLSVQNAGFAATARISDCLISGNTTGVSTTGGGQVITLRNNTWAGNGTDGSTPFSISLK